MFGLVALTLATTHRHSNGLVSYALTLMRHALTLTLPPNPVPSPKRDVTLNTITLILTVGGMYI